MHRSYLEDVAEVPQVEDVVELDGGGQEALRHLLVQRERRLHDAVTHLHDRVGELVDRTAQVLMQDRVVDGV